MKPSSLGDVIHALPVLRHLRHRWPEAYISWWLDTSFYSLLEHDPDLNGLIPFKRKSWAGPGGWRDLFGVLRKVRAEKYDLILDLQGLFRTGILSWLSAGSRLVGVQDLREFAFGFYDHSVPRPSFETHAVDWYLSVIRSLEVDTSKDFVWLPPRETAIQRVLERWPQFLTDQYAVLVPSARWKNKRWPVEYFARLVQLSEKSSPALRFVVVGSGDDVSIGEEIKRAAPGRVDNLAGCTDLPEMIEVIRFSKLVITNDTGPMHVAAALRKPTVSLFGPTHPARTGPYGQNTLVQRMPVPCAPCMKDVCHNPVEIECLRKITPESICAIMARLLDRSE